MRSLTTVCFMTFLLACSGGGSSHNSPKRTPVTYSGDATASDPSDEMPAVEASNGYAVEVPILSSEIIQDALDYTFASLEIISTPKTLYTLKSRSILVNKTSPLNSEARSVMTELCQSVGILSEASGLKVWWRSHYADAKRSVLTSAIAAGQRTLLCIITLEDQKGSPYFLSFDPLPLTDSLVLGSQQNKKAIQSGLMMLTRGVSIKGKGAVKVLGEPDPFQTVKALGGSTLTPIYSQETGAACALQRGSQTVLANPQQVKEFSIHIDSVLVKGTKLIPIAGKTLKACANVMLTVKDSELSMKFTCGDYQATKNEGLEAGCQWNVAVENTSDKEDTLPLTVGMPRLIYKAPSAKSWSAGKDEVAQSPRNPVRQKSVQLNGFSQTQLVFLEKVFDVILEIAPDIYGQDFDGYMKTATLGTTGPCAQSGVMGFAGISGTAITLCQYMFGSGIDSPGAVVGAAHTIIHEVRHARGSYHDIDRPNYTPCQGTAFSNIFDHNIVVTCDSSYCPLLKTAAEGSYMNDINYSLRNDDRRFAGQCKEWQTHMGFSDDRVRAGR